MVFTWLHYDGDVLSGQAERVVSQQRLLQLLQLEARMRVHTLHQNLFDVELSRVLRKKQEIQNY